VGVWVGVLVGVDVLVGLGVTVSVGCRVGVSVCVGEAGDSAVESLCFVDAPPGFADEVVVCAADASCGVAVGVGLGSVEVQPASASKMITISPIMVYRRGILVERSLTCWGEFVFVNG